MSIYRRFITLLLITISSSSCLGRRGFSSIAIINKKNEKSKVGYPDYTTISLPLKAKETYKYKSNLLSTQSIINCNVQTKDRQCSTERSDDDSLFGNTNKEQSKQLIRRSSRRQQDRSDILYTLRGGSSYNGDDDHNDYGYNGGYRDDDVNNGNYNNDGYYNDRPDSSESYSRDGYYEDDSYGRGNEGGGGGGYYDDEGRYHEVDYDDRGRGSSSRKRSKPKLPTALNQSNKKLGTMLLASGGIISALGITLFFNKMLMRLGNILFVIGVPITIGPGRTIGYFLQPKKARATGCLAFGIFLVLVGHPIIGIAMEIFGLFNLFGNMFPFAMMMLKNLPVVGGLFKGGSGGGSGKRRSRYEDDRYYEEERYGGRDEYRREEREDDYRY